MQKIKYCTHRTPDSIDRVTLKSDGSGEVWCPICGQSWDATELSKEEVEELVQKLQTQLQNTVWIGSTYVLNQESFKQRCMNAIECLNDFTNLWETAMQSLKQAKQKITPQDIEVQFKILNSMILQFEKQCNNEAKKINKNARLYSQA